MRTWSAVGRVVRPRGVVRRWPLRAPASTRISPPSPDGVPSRRRLRRAHPPAVDPPLPALAEQRVLHALPARPRLRSPHRVHHEDHARRASPDPPHAEVGEAGLARAAGRRVLLPGAPRLPRPLGPHARRERRPARREAPGAFAVLVVLEHLAGAGAGAVATTSRRAPPSARRPEFGISRRRPGRACRASAARARCAGPDARARGGWDPRGSGPPRRAGPPPGRPRRAAGPPPGTRAAPTGGCRRSRPARAARGPPPRS